MENPNEFVLRKWEVLYQDGLKDVGALLVQVGELKLALDRIFQSAGTEFSSHVQRMESATNGFATRAVAIVEQKAKSTLNDMDASIRNTAMRSAAVATREAVGKEIGLQLADIQSAISKLNSVTQEAGENLCRASRQVAWPWWRRALASFVVIIAALLVHGYLIPLVIGPTPIDQEFIRLGKLYVAVYGNVDTDTRRGIDATVSRLQ